MRIIFPLLFILCLSESISAQGFNAFFNIAPASAPFRNTGARGVVFLDSNALFWGNHTSQFPRTLHTYIAKLSPTGNVLWSLTLGDSGQHMNAVGSRGVTKLRNGKFLLLPWEFLGNPMGFDTYGITHLMWVNENGQLMRRVKLTDSIQGKYISECVELQNGDLLCTGKITSTLNELHSSGSFAWRAHWLVRFDSLGQVIWEKTFSRRYVGISQGDWPYMDRIQGIGDSMFVVSGYKIDSPRVRIWSCFAAFDQNGNPKWERFIHGQNGLAYGFEMNSEAVPMGDSLWFFVTTLSDTLYPGPGGVPTFHSNLRGIYGYLNNQGDTLRVKNVQSRYPTNQYKQTSADQAQILPDGSKLILFGLSIDGTHSQITAIQKLNTNDELQWERWYVYDSAQHYIQHNFEYGMSAAPNGSIYLAGTYEVLNNTAGDSTGTFAWVSRTDSFGCVVPGCHLGDSIFSTPTSLPVVQYPQALEVKLYPNPAQSQVTIEILGEDLPSGLLASVFNYSGQQVVPEQMLLDGKAQLDLTALPAGLYLCRLRSDKGVVTYRKLVKQ